MTNEQECQYRSVMEQMADEIHAIRERLAAADRYRAEMEQAHGQKLYAIEKLLDHFDEEGNLKGNGQWRIREIWQCCKDFDEGSERAAALKPQPQDETGAMNKTEGPWYLYQTSHKWFLVQHRGYDNEPRGYHEGVKIVNELNKLEATREAAPELLAACKAVIGSIDCHEDDFENCTCRECVAYRKVFAAIKKAETTQCSTKSNG